MLNFKFNVLQSVQDVLLKYFGEKVDSRVTPVLFERLFTKMLECISKGISINIIVYKLN